MSSYENQESEQFKLVSLESNAIKTGAQKAKNAYSSYLKDDDEEPSGNTASLQLNEEEPEPNPVVKAPAKKQGTQALKSGTKPLSTSDLSKPSNGKKYNTSDDGVDLFNGNGVEDLGNKISELQESISTLISNFTGTVSAILLKVGAIIAKPFMVIAGIVARILSIPLNIINKIVSSIADRLGVKNKELNASNGIEEEEEAPKVEIKKSNFNEMIELNIFFTDNYKKNLYNKQKNAGFKLSKMEEDLISAMAIDAIKECAEFTAELPAPTSGMYQGRSISQVMEEISNEEVLIFLGFVKAFPGKYIGKPWKISETFATWLINNSPTG